MQSASDVSIADVSNVGFPGEDIPSDVNYKLSFFPNNKVDFMKVKNIYVTRRTDALAAHY